MRSKLAKRSRSDTSRTVPLGGVAARHRRARRGGARDAGRPPSAWRSAGRRRSHARGPRGRWLNVPMRETPADLAAMQALLDRSHAAGGAHLLRILTPERRLTAEQVAERLTGMRLLALATATADGRPIVGPVDGVFLRGAFHFGSAPD